MKKTYTKKQIVEAIKYWKQVLKTLDESKSLLLDACSNEFGEDVVFDDNQMLFKLNEENILALFSILDRFVFDNKLKTLDDLKVFVGSPSALNSMILQYNNNKPIDLSKYFALYQPDYTAPKIPLTWKRTVVIKKNGIFINNDSHKFSTFAYAASCLCHEMIHVYDMYFGKLYNYLVWAINEGAPAWAINQNSHKTSTYKQKKKEFEMATNIPIEDFGNDYSFEKFNEIASKNIELLKEDDNLSIQCPFSKHIIEKYRDSDLVHISDDGMSFSFSFGIPMPK